MKGVAADLFSGPWFAGLGGPLYRMYLLLPPRHLVERAEEMEWYKLLPRDLIGLAYKANDEMAWGREDALKVVSILERSSYDILGVDVWLPTKPGPTPWLRDWSKSDSQSDRGAKSAGEFIASFDWNSLDANLRFEEPLFNIVAELQE
jgi:hypothetical protein